MCKGATSRYSKNVVVNKYNHTNESLAAYVIEQIYEIITPNPNIIDVEKVI